MLVVPSDIKGGGRIKIKKINLKLNLIHLKPTSYGMQDFGFPSMGSEPLAARCGLVE